MSRSPDLPLLEVFVILATRLSTLPILHQMVVEKTLALQKLADKQVLCVEEIDQLVLV